MRTRNGLTLIAILVTSTVACANVENTDEVNPASSESPETYSTPLGDQAQAAGDNAATASDEDEASAAPNTGAAGQKAPAKRADPGPAPTAQCSVQKDSQGFFWRTSSKSDYVAYVPSSYSSKSPMRLIVGLHGCSDDAMNFATWGVNPYDQRAKQNHIGISIAGESGNNRCWSMGKDDDKVLAAVEDIAKCFWVDRSKVVIAGYSSGGQLAYRVGMTKASSFAGILIENSALYAAGLPADELLDDAAWKLPIAHRAHSSDSVFPIDKVKADWSETKKAGFSIVTSEVAGPHDGSSADWQWLIPQSAAWVRTK